MPYQAPCVFFFGWNMKLRVWLCHVISISFVKRACNHKWQHLSKIKSKCRQLKIVDEHFLCLFPFVSFDWSVFFRHKLLHLHHLIEANNTIILHYVVYTPSHSCGLKKTLIFYFSLFWHWSLMLGMCNCHVLLCSQWRAWQTGPPKFQKGSFSFHIF